MIRPSVSAAFTPWILCGLLSPFIWKNGHQAIRRYEGQWRAGQAHGYGAYISLDAGPFAFHCSCGAFRDAEDRWVAIDMMVGDMP